MEPDKLRVDSLIAPISAEEEFLPELEEIWGEMDDYQRFAASYDWDLVVVGDLLVSLECRYRAGEFTSEQEERYAKLKADLMEKFPIMDRLGHSRPEEVLNA
jgi:hypothetical protein